MDSVIDYINQVKKTVDDMYSDIFNISGEEMLMLWICKNNAK